MDNSEQKRAFLLGVGLDNSDGHKRITRAEQFAIVGGSHETHEKMTETLVKTMEELQRKGKPLHAVEKKELADLLHRHHPSS